MTPPRKQPKRARRMWAAKPYPVGQHAVWYRIVSNKKTSVYLHPVCVIPTDAASVEEMVERAAQCCNGDPKLWKTLHEDDRNSYRSAARAVVRDLLGLKGRK